MISVVKARGRVAKSYRPRYIGLDIITVGLLGGRGENRTGPRHGPGK